MIKYWCSSKYNHGDAATNFILNNLGYAAVFSDTPDLIGIGSILGFDDLDTFSDKPYIFGSGFMNELDEIKIPADKVLSLRGKLSAAKYGLSNIPFGDPGLLISKFITPKKEKKYKYGIVCHCTDYEYIKDLAVKKKITCPILNCNQPIGKEITDQDFKEYINKISECEFIFSSSLHGIVFAHALGIPAIHLKNYNNPYINDSHTISQDDFKFKDYYSILSIKYNKVDFDTNFAFLNNTYNKKTLSLPKKELYSIQDNLLDTLYNYTKIKYDVINYDRTAWLCFLSTDNYIYYVLNLYKSLLDSNTRYPVCCGVTKNISKDVRNMLSSTGIKVIDIDTTDIENCSLLANSIKGGMCQRYINALTKLDLIKEGEKYFDRVVYLDSDLQVFENIDELISCPHMSAVEDLAPIKQPEHDAYRVGFSIFCSGLFVWDYKNNPGKIKYIVDNLDSLPDFGGVWHDQTILNYYCQDWKDRPELQLSPTYGLMINNTAMTLFKGNPKIRHYVQAGKEQIPFNECKRIYLSIGNSTIHQAVRDYYMSCYDATNYFMNKCGFYIELPHIEKLPDITPTVNIWKVWF